MWLLLLEGSKVLTRRNLQIRRRHIFISILERTSSRHIIKQRRCVGMTSTQIIIRHRFVVSLLVLAYVCGLWVLMCGGGEVLVCLGKNWPGCLLNVDYCLVLQVLSHLRVKNTLDILISDLGQPHILQECILVSHNEQLVTFEL